MKLTSFLAQKIMIRMLSLRRLIIVYIKYKRRNVSAINSSYEDFTHFINNFFLFKCER